MSAATGGSGTLAGTINGCVYAETANTLAGTTDVKGPCASTGGGGVPEPGTATLLGMGLLLRDRKSTRLNSSHLGISYAVFCLKKKKKTYSDRTITKNDQDPTAPLILLSSI